MVMMVKYDGDCNDDDDNDVTVNENVSDDCGDYYDGQCGNDDSDGNDNDVMMVIMMLMPMMIILLMMIWNIMLPIMRRMKIN